MKQDTVKQHNVNNRSKNDNKKLTLMKTNNMYEAVVCETCNSGIKTRHRCQTRIDSSNVYDGHLGYAICGKAFCCMCNEKWGSDDSKYCGECKGITVGDDEQRVVDESSTKERHNDTPPPKETFTPDYVKSQMILEILERNNEQGKKQNNNIGQKLIEYRANEVIKKIITH